MITERIAQANARTLEAAGTLPPGLGPKVDLLTSWTLGISGVLAVIALIGVGISMYRGHSRQQPMSEVGESLGKVLGGAVLGVVASGVIKALI